MHILTKLYQVVIKLKTNFLKSFERQRTKEKELDELWKDIAGKDGSVQHLDILTDEEKEVFKTANEINQIWVVEHAYQRQQYICQAQSVNLFLLYQKQQKNNKCMMITCSMLMMFIGMV